MTIQVLEGDCGEVLATLDAGSVHCVVTSPPYWGLRDYGTASWQDGEPGCDHVAGTARQDGARHGVDGFAGSKTGNGAMGITYFRDVCGKCGARRVDRQLGLEATSGEYLERMVAVFREVRRVLRPDGVCWLNMGDCYAGSWGNQGRKEERGTQRPINGESLQVANDGRYPDNGSRTGSLSRTPGLKPKDLIGMPWRLAFALQADGWYLRAEVIWHKPNPMPEFVTDRPTKAHEQVFLLSRSPRYFYDAEAVKEDATGRDPGNISPHKHDDGTIFNRTKVGLAGIGPASSRNLRSVWSIATAPFSEAHFATFPPELAERCIKAGTSVRGCCPVCGAPWVRVVERSSVQPLDYNGKHSTISDEQASGRRILANTRARRAAGNPHDNPFPPPNTIGWRPSCTCPSAAPQPCTVLDPFAGAGTTLMVADRLQRHAIGIELNSSYVAMLRARVAKDRGPLLEYLAGE